MTRVFTNISITNKIKVGKKFVNCTFVNCMFENIVFSNCTFENCTFSNCNFFDITLRHCVFKNVTFKLCAFFDAFLIGNNLQFKEIVGCRFVNVESSGNNDGFWFFGSFNEISYCVARIGNVCHPIIGGSLLSPNTNVAIIEKFYMKSLLDFLKIFAKEN